jgi:hypothetical protein
MMVAISSLGPKIGSKGLAEAPRAAFEIGTVPFSPGGVPSEGTEVSSPGEILGTGTEASCLSRMEGLTRVGPGPRGGGSRLDLSRARASAASLSC